MVLSSGKRSLLLGLIVFLLLLVTIPIILITALQRQNLRSPAGPGLRAPAAGSPFVTKSGPNLLVNGSPLRLVGYNWHWMGTGCLTPTDTQIATTFAQIKTASHGNVVRTAFYQSGSNKGAYTDFDRYIAYAKAYGLYIVPLLVNHWLDCEPSKATKPPSWYESGYKHTNDGYPLSFRDYAIKLARHYGNEPTIAFWQLVNEPDARPCGSAGAHILRSFADDMITALKAVDPNHMVDLGTPGECAGDSIPDYTTIVGGKVDLCNVWDDYGQAKIVLPSQMQQRIGACRNLNKPSFVGESGICADVIATGDCSGIVTTATLRQRAAFFAAKLSAGFNAGLAGYIIWNRGSESVQDDIGPGDPTESVLAKYAFGALKVTLYTYHGHTSIVTGLAWSPDGKRIASASQDETVQVWDAATGDNVLTYRGHTSIVTAVAWSPDGGHIASASQDGAVQLWNATTGAYMFTYRGHMGTVTALAWSPDGTRIASSSWDKTVQVWDATTGKRLLTYQGHTSIVAAVAWSPDGGHIASASADHTVQVWDAATGTHVYTYHGHAGPVNALAWSPDSKRIASGSDDHKVMIWDASTGGHVFIYTGHSDAVKVLAWSPDSRYLASTSLDGTVQLWNAAGGTLVFAYQGHTSIVTALVWSPDSTRIASGSTDVTVQVWLAGS
jgi:Tol biopolymer transport system component